VKQGRALRLASASSRALQGLGLAKAALFAEEQDGRSMLCCRGDMQTSLSDCRMITLYECASQGKDQNVNPILNTSMA
jgi:hypothetical protein